MQNELPRLLVIGNGMVGQRLLESLVGAPARWQITVLCEEPRPAYDRVQLSAFFSGTSAAQLSLVEHDFFARHGIDCRLGECALAIDRERRLVRSSAGNEYAYDALVLATGSAPFVPPVPGRDREACFVYRTIEDLEAITAAAHGSRSGVVIGGGLLGLEAARALRDLGLETHVIEFAPRLMAVQLDEGAARLLRTRIETLGVKVHTGKNTREIVAGESARHRLVFADASQLETDLVVFSAGIRPREELARAAGLALGARGGIAIDPQCRSLTDPAVFAIGECAAWNDRVYGLVAPGYRMAEIAAAALNGAREPCFAGADMSTRLKLLGVEVASLGDAHAAAPGAQSYAFVDERRQLYRKLVVNEDGTRVLGGILVGETSDYGTWLQLMLNGLALPASPEQLLVPAAGGGENAPALGIAALPATAQVCSCNNVSKAAICGAVAAGCTTLGALKKNTRAASSCGGCAPLVGQILKSELARAGVAVNNHLCEHFPFTRQELFHLVRVGEIRSFETLLAKHGKGNGCDICKPTVASILASCWNEFVLSPRHASLQDTNDHFLANMQKDGTYSVVPRIPGGEITPQRLIAIGQVAARYGLYTKITGGQRIDLFGARVHELPSIWRELIDAGFESGHAYGKAVRTVKSCVGSTWCRFGVQDSVGLAIAIEHRYRGLRAPHKLKLAVSGCTRECAEAQSKDVGVIATEKGWNLYVCGNGGMKPRHADLLARDIDTETLVRFIDRFLMFYIRTADRLQRTATWLDHLEGGLEYLRGVVCEDTLGIGAELEAEMARLVAGYECEWKKAIEDPHTLKRFRHFVNSEALDDNVVFVQERGQIRPANAAERAAAPVRGDGLMRSSSDWQAVCALEDIVPDSGVCAELGGRQIAVFRVDRDVYALDNHDPASGANVLARGIVGDLGGERVVASPLYKHHYALATGRCLEDPALAIDTFLARVIDQRVWVRPGPALLRRRTARQRLVVVGNGMAAMRTVEELLVLAPDACEITVFGAEPHGNYNRILLSPVLAGDKRVEDIVLHPVEWYRERGIRLYAGDPVVAIDRRGRRVIAQSGISADYDRLLLATGSSPIVLPIPGALLPGVVAFRDLHDVATMLRAARPGASAAVIGGGLLGLEAAEGLRRRGMAVTVVHLFETLMERQLDAPAAQMLQTELESRGIRFRMAAKTAAVRGETHATGLRFDDGSELDAELVVMAAGIRPNIDLAKQAGLRCGRGVLVDDTLQSFDPAIYAVGECVEHRNTTYGLVAPLWEQARACAAQLAERGARAYRGSMVATQLKVAGIEVFSAGDFLGSRRSEPLCYNDPRRGIYKRLVIEGDRLRGAVLYGDTHDAAWYQELIAARRPLGALRETLLFGPAFAAAG